MGWSPALSSQAISCSRKVPEESAFLRCRYERSPPFLLASSQSILAHRRITSSLQFAKAAGARVIATTSTSAKAEILTRLGADHVLNYTTDPHWGDTAKNLTPGKAGVHHVIEVGGPTTMTQSLRAVRPEGVISIIGFLGGMRQEDQPTFLECLSRSCTVRGVMVGSRAQFEAMNEAVDACGLKPVVDRRVFGMREAREAYQYMWEKKHLVGYEFSFFPFSSYISFFPPFPVSK